jgi:Zn-dependent protease with chaperone function
MNAELLRNEVLLMTETTPDQIFVYEHDASRLELFIRIVYWIAIGIVAWVYGILAMICLFIQWFFILIMGRRQQGLSDFAKGYFEYIVSRMPYMYFMTDVRPQILPDPVKIYMD